MGIGVGIFLIAVGAILGFAVEDNVSGVDLKAVGYILMVVGLIGLLLTAFIWGPRNRGRSDVVVEERRTHDDRGV